MPQKLQDLQMHTLKFNIMGQKLPKAYPKELFLNMIGQAKLGKICLAMFIGKVQKHFAACHKQKIFVEHCFVA